MLEESDQGAAYFGGVSVDHLGEVTDLETVRGNQETIQLTLFCFLLLKIPFSDQLPNDSGCRVVQSVEPLHADALAGVGKQGSVVTFIMRKVAALGIVFG